MPDSVPGPHGNTLVNKNCETEVSRKRTVNQAKGHSPMRKVYAHALWQPAVCIKPGVKEGWKGDLQIPARCVRLSGRSWVSALKFFFFFFLATPCGMWDLVF